MASSLSSKFHVDRLTFAVRRMLYLGTRHLEEIIPGIRSAVQPWVEAQASKVPQIFSRLYQSILTVTSISKVGCNHHGQRVLSSFRDDSVGQSFRAEWGFFFPFLDQSKQCDDLLSGGRMCVLSSYHCGIPPRITCFISFGNQPCT
jgi:hypothetical protein